MSDDTTAVDGGDLAPETFLAEVTNDVPTDSVAAGQRDEGYAVVYAPADAQQETARALLDAAEAAELPIESVRTSDGAFIVPREIADSAELPDGVTVAEGTSVANYATAVRRTPGDDDDAEPRTSPDSPNAALQPAVVQDGTAADDDAPKANANKAELRAYVNAQGIAVDDDATVAELREAIDGHRNRPRPS